MDSSCATLLLVLLLAVYFTEASKVDGIPVPIFTVDLNLPPEERWSNISETYAEKLSGFFSEGMSRMFSPRAVRMLSIMAAGMLQHTPQPYRDEIMGVAKHTNISVGTIVAWNLIYDFGVFDLNDTRHFNSVIGCTSIVAEDSKGKIIHGRNLDLEWMPEVLREMTLTVDFQMGNKTLYTGTTLAGVVGLWTGQKPHRFTLSLDERDKGQWWENAHEVIEPGRHIISFLFRDVLADPNSNFNTAVQTLSTTPLIAPVYFIVGGAHPGEGAVITRQRTKAINTMKLDADHGRWYVLETNYDHWDPPPTTDDRRDPAIRAMNKIGKDNINSESLYKVLSTPPVLSNITIFTMVMSAAQPDLYKVLIRMPH